MKNKAVLVSCTVVDNIQISLGYFLIKFDSAQMSQSVCPGQFFNIKVADRLDILLRRPFSVFNVEGSVISILYEVVGKGTKELSRKKKGDRLDVLGPLGNRFSLQSETKQAILVGGGMGVAPLYLWARELLKQKDISVKILIGAKTKMSIVCDKDFGELGIETRIATDDGSMGSKGFVTDLLKEECGKCSSQSVAVYACGPNAMLKEVAGILLEKNVEGEISLDRHMACGIGVCLGCVIKIKSSESPDGFIYKRVCKDGPVFKAEEVIL